MQKYTCQHLGDNTPWKAIREEPATCTNNIVSDTPDFILCASNHRMCINILQMSNCGLCAPKTTTILHSCHYIVTMNFTQ